MGKEKTILKHLYCIYVCVLHTYMFKSDFTVYKGSLNWKAVGAHLCSCAPVEPAHIGWVSEVRVDPAGDQHMAMGLFILDDMVEVWTGRQHGRLTKAFTTQHHEQTHKAQPVQLLQLWGRGDADLVYSTTGHMTQCAGQHPYIGHVGSVELYMKPFKLGVKSIMSTRFSMRTQLQT